MSIRRQRLHLRPVLGVDGLQRLDPPPRRPSRYPVWLCVHLQPLQISKSRVSSAVDTRGRFPRPALLPGLGLSSRGPDVPALPLRGPVRLAAAVSAYQPGSTTQFLKIENHEPASRPTYLVAA